MTTAEELIGQSTPGDSLRVREIANALPPEAEALKDVLLDSSVVGLDQLRRRTSNEAAEAQNWLKRLAASVVIGSGIAALTSGFLLYGQGMAETPAGEVSPSLLGLIQRNLTVITAIQVLGLFAATTAGAVLASRDFGKIWTEKRRAAEADRVVVLENALKLAIANPGAPGAASPLRQFLEFFRRYQLDLQCVYYQKRGKDHTGSESRQIWVVAIFGGIAAVSGILGSLGTVHPALPVLAAFLGIAVPILLSSAQSWRTVSRAAEKAAAYRAAGEALDKLRLETSRIRTAANNGDVDAVKKFVSDCHGIMRTESGAFIGSGTVDIPKRAKP